jgi:hypothetical protein
MFKFLLVAVLTPFAAFAQSEQPVYSECNYINCDCANLDWGLLTPEFRAECRATERSIKQQCSDGIPLEKLSCNTIAYGPKAFPLEGSNKPTPEENADKQIDDLCKRLRGEMEDDDDSRENPYTRAIHALQPVQKDFPGMGLVLRAAELRAQSASTLESLQSADFYLKASQDYDPNFAASAATELLSAAEYSDKGSLADPAAQLVLNRMVERMVNLGLAKQDLSGNSSEVLEYLEILQKLHKAGYSAAQLAEMKENQTKQFVESVVDLFPEMTNPVLNGPVAIVFSDQLHWTQDLYRDSTNALELVANAIETGKFDSAAYQRIADHIQVLSLQGPWGKKTALGALKKWSEQIPFLGKLVKVFIEDPETAKGQLPDFCKDR